MPELPDVEHYRRTFAEAAPGRVVRQVLVTDVGILRNAGPLEVDGALRGRRLGEPERRGKWLIAPADGPALLIHFGMTGDLLWAPDAMGRHRHDRLILVLDRGELRYRNMRKLGGVWLGASPGEVDAILGHLGPDAADLGRGEFLELLRSRRGRVKAALLDQTFVAGIGNLLADEILWRARIHPGRPIDSLDEHERGSLFRELRRVVRSTVDRYPGGYHVAWMRARGRPGAVCPRCRAPLERAAVGGRTTYFCPACQDPRGRRQGSSSALGPSWYE